MDKVRFSVKYYNKIVAVSLFFIGLGTVFYHLVEHFAWIDSLYFTVVTLATIGYGDFVPHTTAGKLFTIFYVIIGITIFIALAQTILAKIVNRRVEHVQKRKKS